MADFAVRTFRRPGAPVHGTLFRTARPSAGVLVIGGSGGSEPSYVGEALAREGIGALSVAYFGRPGLPGRLRDIPLEYFLAALRVLQEAMAPGAPVVVLGMSRGSEAAGGRGSRSRVAFGGHGPGAFRGVREHGDPHGHTVLEYPEAGHSLGYLIPRLPPGLLPPDLVDEPADQAARADAWPRVVDFICRAGGI
jgi:predicted alpha/beta hydrolase